jgi:hypothetical protein
MSVQCHSPRFVSATEATNCMSGAASRSKCLVNGNVGIEVSPATLFQAARCGTRRPPASVRVTYTTSASPHQRRAREACVRVAQSSTYTHTASPLSNTPLPLASSISDGSSIVT